jgi:hypothetical protein
MTTAPGAFLKEENHIGLQPFGRDAHCMPLAPSAHQVRKTGMIKVLNAVEEEGESTEVVREQVEFYAA